MHFFLQGNPQIGKSYLLQNTLQQHHVTITGFTPQRLYNKHNQIMGYRAELMQNNSAIIQLDGTYASNVHNIFLDFQEQYKKIDVLEDLIHQVRKNTSLQDYDLIMLDEIGGFELASQTFLDDLFYLLDTNSCVGVLKHRTRSMAHAEHSSNIEQHYNMLLSKIEQNGQILTLQKNNYDEIIKQFEIFLSKFHKEKSTT